MSLPSYKKPVTPDGGGEPVGPSYRGFDPRSQVSPDQSSRIISVTNFFHPGYALKNLSILTQKIVSKLSEIWSGLVIPDPDPSRIPDPGVKKAPDPWPVSATLPEFQIERIWSVPRPPVLYTWDLSGYPVPERRH